MTERVTTERVTAEQDDVQSENDRTDSNTERGFAARIPKPERLPNVDRKDDNKNQRNIKEVAMNVLHDEREGTLSQIRRTRLTDRAGGRIGPKRFVVRAAIVITGKAKPPGRPKNEQRGRE